MRVSFLDQRRCFLFQDESHLLSSGFKFSQLEMSEWLVLFFLTYLTRPVAEVVLVVLLTSFKFSMSEKSKEVVWNMAGIRYPTVGKVSGHAEFPMKLTPIED